MRVWGRTKRVGALALLFLCLAILGQRGTTAQTSTATLIGPIAKFRRTCRFRAGWFDYSREPHVRKSSPVKRRLMRGEKLDELTLLR